MCCHGVAIGFVLVCEESPLAGGGSWPKHKISFGEVHLEGRGDGVNSRYKVVGVGVLGLWDCNGAKVNHTNLVGTKVVTIARLAPDHMVEIVLAVVCHFVVYADFVVYVAHSGYSDVVNAVGGAVNNVQINSVATVD